MRHVDFSPLYRSTVGFDRLFNLLDNRNLGDQAQSYPPYNIERTGDNTYRITMAVAGFDEKELSIEFQAHSLTVKGEKSDDEAGAETEYLYRGIAKRAFERRFQLADRGSIAEGCVADLVVVDPATVTDHATYDNPRQLATGVADVVVAGEPVLRDGALTGATPGRALRRGESGL